MSRPAALLVLGAGSPLMLVCFLLGGEPAAWIFAALAMAFPVALITLGASRSASLGPIAGVLALLLLLLEASLLGMLVLSPLGSSLWLGGFPAATAVMIYGLWLSPLALVAWGYAATFSRIGLRPEDLERVRRFRKVG